MSRDRNVLEATKTEGGLLPADVLQRIARGDKDVPGLTPRDFHLEGTETTSEAITRSWNRLLGIWAAFRSERAKLPEGDHATGLTQNRWLLPLFSELGYGRLARQPAGTFQIGEQTFDISHTYHRSPILLVGAGVDLEKRHATAPGASQASPHGVVQDFLNKSDHHLWGIVTNGLRLRLLRDHRSLTRLAYVELDLEAIFDGELFHAFRLVWLLCHQSRVEADRPEECWLEKWHGIVQTNGVAALDKLRDGVKSAIETLGRGFLRPHAQNHELKDLLASGKLDKQDYYRELLRLAYRLIFLFVTEDRDLLLERGTDPQILAARRRYEQYYSTRRLRDLARKRRSSAHGDLWLSLRVVFDLVNGSPASQKKRLLLALPALGSFLWAKSSLPHLAFANLPNEDLLAAVLALSTTEDRRKHRYPVNWRSLGAEELGSVYESLLELRPEISKDAATFELRLAAGHERKTTGSYYTPSSLVECLLDSALDPVVEDAVRGKSAADGEAAILGLTVCDPACGSGHFLLAAARRLARRLAQIRADYAEPSPRDVTHALRDVVGRCIFGVDLNPMAVELCKVALWMEAVEPGLPLTFLDSHIQRGNALLGTTPELMAKGIPDAAWEPIEGDDRKIASALKKQNKEDAKAGVLDLGAAPVSTYARLGAGARAVDDQDDATLADVESKERHWAELVASSAFEHQRFLADTWCAAFVWRKEPGTLREIAPTEAVFRALQADRNRASAALREEVRRLSEQYAWFHWPLQFSQVFAKGGFDVVLGNPPWDTLSPDAKEFFSEWDPAVRSLSPEAQATRLEELLAERTIRQAWTSHCRELYGQVAYIKGSGRYRLFAPGNLGKGDFNVFRMFVELALATVRTGGCVSQVVPEGLYSGANSMKLREALFDRCSLRLMLGFENTAGVWFPGVHRSQKFACYSAQVPGRTEKFRAAFNLRSQGELAEAVAGRALELPVSVVREFSPDALAVMEFSDQLEVDIVAKMYSQHPKFGDESAGEPLRHYMRELDMGNDRGLFIDGPEGLPLYEGRMINIYDHRAKGYRSGRGRQAEWEELPFRSPLKTIQPQWRIRPERVPPKARERVHRYRVGWCDVTGSTNARTLLATLLPPDVLCGDSVPNFVFAAGQEWAYLVWLACANSFCMDFVVRRKVTSHVKYTHLDSLPFPRLSNDDPRASFLVPRVARLVCTGPEMVAYWNSLSAGRWVEPFPASLGVPGELLPSPRALMEAELDAYVARNVFGLAGDQLAYILDTFPIVEKRDRKEHGEYRTKRVILEIYDAMAEAARTGKPYQTRLDPSPADPTCAHPAEDRPRTNGAPTPNTPNART